MDGAYLYSYDTHDLCSLKPLDDIREPADVLAFRDELHQALNARGSR